MQRDKKILIPILVIGLLLGLVALRYLSVGPLLVGDEPYRHAWVAQYLRESGLGKVSTGVANDSPEMPSAYDLLLFVSSAALGIPLSNILIPMLLSLISLYLFWRLLGRFGFSDRASLFAMVLFCASPFFLFSSLTGDDGILLMAIQLLFFVLFIDHSAFSFIGAICCSVLATTFGIAHLLLDLVYAIVVCQVQCKGDHKFLIYLLGTLLVVGSTLPFFGFEPKSLLIGSRPDLSIVSDFGSPLGVSVFVVLLGFFGMMVLFNRERFAATAVVLLCLSALFTSQLIVYFSIALIFCAALFLDYLWKRDWAIPQLRNITLLLLVCGLIFSSVSFGVRWANSAPDKDMVAALVALSTYSDKDSVVFSGVGDGIYISSIASRKVYLDRTIPKDDLRQRQARALYDSYDLGYVKGVFAKEGITHIFIAPQMYQGEVWSRPGVGLSYLVQSNETFKNVYQANGYSIYALR